MLQALVTMLTHLSVSDLRCYTALNLILMLDNPGNRVVNLESESSEVGQLQGADVELGDTSGIARFKLKPSSTISEKTGISLTPAQEAAVSMIAEHLLGAIGTLKPALKLKHIKRTLAPEDHLESIGRAYNSHTPSTDTSSESRIAFHSSESVGEGLLGDAAVCPFPEGLSVIWPKHGRKRDSRLISSSSQSSRESPKPQVSERDSVLREMRKLPVTSKAAAPRRFKDSLRVVIAMIKALEKLLNMLKKQQVRQLLHVNGIVCFCAIDV